MSFKRTQGVLLVLISLAFVGVIVLYTGALQPAQSVEPGAESQTGAITLTIEGLYESQSVSIVTGETALAVLDRLDAQDPAVKLSTKEYAGLGVLVDGIGELKNGTNGKYWQYRVNGVMPQVGAGAYVLKNGDVVEWFFAASQE